MDTVEDTNQKLAGTKNGRLVRKVAARLGLGEAGLEAKAGKIEAAFPRAQEQLGVQRRHGLASGPQGVELDRRVGVHGNLQELQRGHGGEQPGQESNARV